MMTKHTSNVHALHVAANLLRRADALDTAGLHRRADSVAAFAMRQAQYGGEGLGDGYDPAGHTSVAPTKAPAPDFAREDADSEDAERDDAASDSTGNQSDNSDPFAAPTGQASGGAGTQPLTSQDVQGMANADFHTPQWQSYLRYLNVTDPHGFQQLLSTVGWDRLYQPSAAASAPLKSQDEIHKQEADKLIAQGIFVPGYSQGEKEPNQPLGLVVKPGATGNTYGPSPQDAAKDKAYMAKWKRDQPFQYADYAAQHPEDRV